MKLNTVLGNRIIVWLLHVYSATIPGQMSVLEVMAVVEVEGKERGS